MIYQWKSYQYPVEAQVAGEELERIREVAGGITQALIVESARPEESVLHKCFEWNDGIAGAKWRESQAGLMIRTLVIVNPAEDPEKENLLVRAFVNVTSKDDERFFIPTIEALTNCDYRNQVMQQAIRELISFQKKYKELSELAEVFNAIESVAK